MAGKPGVGGPVPKRSTERRRRNDSVLQLITAQAGDAASWPEADPAWGELARYAYEAAQRSGQSRFYEQTDVALLRFACEAMDRCLRGAGTRSGHGMSPQMVQAVTQIFGLLLFSEADRRRLRIELERAPKFTFPGLAEYKREHGIG